MPTHHILLIVVLLLTEIRGALHVEMAGLWSFAPILPMHAFRLQAFEASFAPTVLTELTRIFAQCAETSFPMTAMSDYCAALSVVVLTVAWASFASPQVGLHVQV